MLEFLPNGVAVAALQAGPFEGSAAQRVLVATSNDGGGTFSSWNVAVPSSGDAQWEPTLFYDATSKALWLFYTEGPSLVYASQSLGGRQTS